MSLATPHPLASYGLQHCCPVPQCSASSPRTACGWPPITGRVTSGPRTNGQSMFPSACGGANIVAQPLSRLVAPSVSFVTAVGCVLDTAAPPASEPLDTAASLQSDELSLHSADLDASLRSGSTFIAAGGKALLQRDPSMDDPSPSFVRLNGMMSLSSTMTPSAAAGERSSRSLGLVAPSSPLSSESAVSGGEDDSVKADENDDEEKEREIDVLGGTAPFGDASRVKSRLRRSSDDPSLFLTSSNNVIGRDSSPSYSSNGTRQEMTEAIVARQSDTDDVIDTLAIVGGA